MSPNSQVSFQPVVRFLDGALSTSGCDPTVQVMNPSNGQRFPLAAKLMWIAQ